MDSLHQDLEGIEIKYRITDMSVSPRQLAKLKWMLDVLSPISQDQLDAEPKPDRLLLSIEDLPAGINIKAMTFPVLYYAFDGGVAFMHNGCVVPLELPSDSNEVWAQEQMEQIQRVAKRNQQYGITPPADFERSVTQKVLELERLIGREAEGAFGSTYQANAVAQHQNIAKDNHIQSMQDTIDHLSDVVFELDKVNRNIVPQSTTREDIYARFKDNEIYELSEIAEKVNRTYSVVHDALQVAMKNWNDQAKALCKKKPIRLPAQLARPVAWEAWKSKPRKKRKANI